MIESSDRFLDFFQGPVPRNAGEIGLRHIVVMHRRRDLQRFWRTNGGGNRRGDWRWRLVRWRRRHLYFFNLDVHIADFDQRPGTLQRGAVFFCAGFVEVVFDPTAHGPAGVGKIERVVTLENNSSSDLNIMFSAFVTP